MAGKLWISIKNFVGPEDLLNENIYASCNLVKLSHHGHTILSLCFCPFTSSNCSISAWQSRKGEHECFYTNTLIYHNGSSHTMNYVLRFCWWIIHKGFIKLSLSLLAFLHIGMAFIIFLSSVSPMATSHWQLTNE